MSCPDRRRFGSRRITGAVVAIMAAIAALAMPASAEPQGYVEIPFEYGFFYGTFGESPEIALLAGGDAEEFCIAGHDGGASIVPGRLFHRADGEVDIKVNVKDQPIYLYHIDSGIPVWLDQVCGAYFGHGVPLPEAFASGTADLKVRISDAGFGNLDIYNGVRGKATATDGTQYKVTGTADFRVVNGELADLPIDFVGFKLQEIRRGQ